MLADNFNYAATVAVLKEAFNMQMLKSISKTMKGFTIGELAGIAIAFVIVAFTLAMGASILTDLQGTQTASSYAYNASGYGLSALDTMASWLPTLGLVVIAAVIIGVLIFYLGRRTGG